MWEIVGLIMTVVGLLALLPTVYYWRHIKAQRRATEQDRKRFLILGCVEEALLLSGILLMAVKPKSDEPEKAAFLLVVTVILMVVVWYVTYRHRWSPRHF